MTPLALAYPVLAQVLLTLVLMLTMGRARVAAVRRGEVRVSDVALGERLWPTRVQQLSINLHNQFETPVLFYVLCGLAMFAGATNGVTVVLAWAYVATRLVHSYIHTTSNRIGQRFRVFAVGVVILSVLWLVVVLRIAAAI